MMGHIIVPAYGQEKPASLSEKMVQMARMFLAPDGLIITDALDMKGAGSKTPAELAIEAYKAGNDLLICRTGISEAIKRIADQVRNGEISEQSVNERYARIQAYQKKLGVGL